MLADGNEIAPPAKRADSQPCRRKQIAFRRKHSCRLSQNGKLPLILVASGEVSR
jgi:hypothetical protein